MQRRDANINSRLTEGMQLQFERGDDLFVRGGGRAFDRPWRPQRHLTLLPLILLPRAFFANTIWLTLLTVLDHDLAPAAVIWITPL